MLHFLFFSQVHLVGFTEVDPGALDELPLGAFD
jgi:hypothetical protein